MIHWNAHLVCNWLRGRPAQGFLFCLCDVGRPSNSLNWKHFECSEPDKGSGCAVWRTGLWIKTRRALREGFYPSLSSHPPPWNRTIINCHCQSHNQEQGWREAGRASERARNSQHLSWAPPQDPHKHARHMREVPRHTGCYYWFSGLTCETPRKYRSHGDKRCFLSFKSCNRSATPGRWLALYLDGWSIEP